MRFKTLELQQGTYPWHQWRRGGVGASDAPVIMGWNRFKTREDLLLEKLNIKSPPPQNLLMKQGIDNEIVAKQLYEKKFKVKLSKPTCIQHIGYEWLRASLDAANFIEDYVVEIKCGKANYEHHLGTRAIVPWVNDQLQHVLAVTGYPFLYLWCWHPGELGLRRKVRRNEKYINKLIDKEQEFWFEVEERRKSMGL